MGAWSGGGLSLSSLRSRCVDCEMGAGTYSDARKAERLGAFLVLDFKRIKRTKKVVRNRIKPRPIASNDTAMNCPNFFAELQRTPCLKVGRCLRGPWLAG